jgi:hypothetical protein
MEFEIDFYKDKQNRNPVEKFILELRRRGKLT